MSSTFFHIFKRIAAFIPLCLLVGCNYERTKTLQVEPARTWFASLQARVFNPSCVKCHNPGKPGGGLDLTSYDALMESNKIVKGDCHQSPLFLALTAGRMPPAPNPKVSPEDLAAIGAWIDAGASPTLELPQKPGTPVVVEPPPVLEPKFSSIRKVIIETRCLGCHSGPKPKGDLDLSTYKTTLSSSGVVTPGEPLESSLLQRLLSDTDPMPPKGPKVTEAEVTTIETWINNGALDN